MIAMPICDSIVCAKLERHSSGTTSNTSAKPPKTQSRRVRSEAG